MSFPLENLENRLSVAHLLSDKLIDSLGLLVRILFIANSNLCEFLYFVRDGDSASALCIKDIILACLVVGAYPIRINIRVNVILLRAVFQVHFV